MATSEPLSSPAEIAVFVLLLLGTVLVIGGGHNATSSPPPPKIAPSGLLLRTPSPEQLEALSTGLEPGLEIKEAYAIKSTRHSRAWYVGAQLERAGRTEEIAVWLATGPNAHPEHLYSVDREAQDASAWPDGSSHRVSTSSIDQEALALRRVLRSR
jgi:hypothetical protein